MVVHGGVIFYNNFDDDPVGTYSVTNLKADWNNPSSNDGVDEGRVEIVDGPNAWGAKSLVVNYPQGLSNTGKSQWKTPLGAGYEELYLSYRLRFGDNFDFVRGGKLPGLAGGAANSGGNIPDGTDGWSARMMWRTNGSGGSTTNGTQSQFVQYVYHKDMPGPSGEDFKWDDNPQLGWPKIDSGVWYHVQHRIKMNTPGQDDGIIQAWLDGELVLNAQDLHFRDISSLKIDLLYFSTFFGGSSPPWEATKDEQVFFDDFIVSTTPIGSGIPGDLDRDGFVGIQDLNLVLGRWNDNVSTGDTFQGEATGDGFVGIEDLNVVLGNWNASETPPVGLAVPEPATAGVLLILSSSMAYGRRRG
ncbi:MAG: hypothetical protein Kow00105_17540 [Phycisphaeraceae bacterium]